MTKVKICGLKRPEDIKMINEFKPDYAGFIINFPKSHRSISPETVIKLVENLDRKNVKAVGVFVDEPVENVAGLVNEGVLDLVQLHGNEDEEYVDRLRTLVGEKKDFIIKAFKIENLDSLEKAFLSTADFILLDQGKGSGETFDWSILSEKRALDVFEGNVRLKGRWLLAGGINEENIKIAIEKFHPFAVDLSSAVETERVKDRKKVKKIIELVRK